MQYKHFCRYVSGDRLSAEHEKTITERLLPYHPEFEKKIGCGIDYITVCLCNVTVMLSTYVFSACSVSSTMHNNQNICYFPMGPPSPEHRCS